MRNLVIDSRMREIEKEYLRSLGFCLLEIHPNKELYAEISAHPDIQIAKVKDKTIIAPNSNIKIEDALIGNMKIGAKYPNSVRYNVCTIGNYFIHNLEYTDTKIIDIVDNLNMTKIDVKQGYTKCSIAVTSNNSCITSDKNIYEKLQSFKIDCLYIEEESIHLTNENGLESKMRGFIGGCTAVIDSKFILFGDKNNLTNLNGVEDHLKKYGLEFVDFPGLSIHDYGGIIEI